MKKFSILFLLVMPVVLTSCMENAYMHMLLRSPEDPFDDAPVVDQCSEYLRMNVSWKEDPCADYYVLMRHDEDTDNDKYDEVYRGTGFSYTEVLTESTRDKRYIYRLDKYRGNTGYFKGSSYGYGFNNMSTTYEPNDSLEQAVFLEDPVDEQITVIRYSDGHLYEDCDYFYIRVPSKKIASIIVTQKGVSAKEAADLYYNIKEKAPDDNAGKIINGQEFSIENTMNQAAYFHFYIMAKKSSVEQVKKSAQFNYTISVAKWYEGQLQ